MNVPPTLHAVATASASRALGPVRGIGKSNTSRTLDGECAGDGEFRGAPHTERRHVASSRNGTTDYAPLWNGPRLRAAFVAQVLGQVMMDPSDAALSLAPAAYAERGAQIPHGSFFCDEV